MTSQGADIQFLALTFSTIYGRLNNYRVDFSLSESFRALREKKENKSSPIKSRADDKKKIYLEFACELNREAVLRH